LARLFLNTIFFHLHRTLKAWFRQPASSSFHCNSTQPLCPKCWWSFLESTKCLEI
jgi:hypothetical protein